MSNNRPDISEQEQYVLRQRNLVFERIIISIAALNCLAIVAQLFLLSGAPDLTASLIVNVTAILIMFCCLLLNQKGFSKISKVITLTFLNLLVIVPSMMYPARMGFFCFIPAFMLLASFVFDKSENNLRIIFILLSFICVIEIVVIDQGKFPVQVLSEEGIRIGFFASLLSASVIFFSILYFNVKINRRIEAWLSEFAEKEKKRSQYYENVNIQLENFMNRTTHDLRSPLASIKGLVFKAIYEIKDPKSVAVFQKIDERIESLDVFSKDLIEYSKNELREVVRQPVDLAALSNDVTESLKYMRAAEKINFLTDISFEESVYIDKDRLKIVLANLVSNAIKYHNPAQDNPFVKISATRTSSELTLVVEDNGTGIAQEYQEKIFNMFYRASEIGQGSGLGLFITKAAIEKMGGQISVHSVEGRGSSFELRIPLNTEYRGDHG